jgi:hypothetical protein
MPTLTRTATNPTTVPLAVRQITPNTDCTMIPDAQARVLQPIPATVPSLQNTCFFTNRTSPL